MTGCVRITNTYIFNILSLEKEKKKAQWHQTSIIWQHWTSKKWWTWMMFSVCAACLDMSSPYLFKLVFFCLRVFRAQSSWGQHCSVYVLRLAVDHHRQGCEDCCVFQGWSLPGRKRESQKVGGPLHRSPLPSLLLTEGERWQLFCCCCWAPEPCSAPAMHRRIITISSLIPWRKEWIWPWRSSTLILQSSIIFSSSGLSSSRTFRYIPVCLKFWISVFVSCCAGVHHRAVSWDLLWVKY